MFECQNHVVKASCAKQLISIVVNKEESNSEMTDLDYQMLNVAAELLDSMIVDGG